MEVASPHRTVLRNGSVAVGIIAASTLWPIGIWNDYRKSPKLDLAGAGLMRIDAGTTLELQQVVQVLHAQCDTFYGVPDENSFYVFADMPALTGMAADRPVSLDNEQQLQVVAALQAKAATGGRVCILRDSSQGTVVQPGPLNVELGRYLNVVATIGNYTVSTHG